MQRQKSSPYAPLISEATGAPAHRLELLENLMRDAIFHSTLDWQSAELLAAGAREANALYLSAPAYYEAMAIHQRSRFRVAKLEERLEKARRTAAPDKLAEIETLISLARESERQAREALPRLATHYAIS